MQVGLLFPVLPLAKSYDAMRLSHEDEDWRVRAMSACKF